MEKNIHVYEVTVTDYSVTVTILGYELYQKHYKRQSSLKKHFEQIVREITCAVEDNNLFWRCVGFRKVKTFLVPTTDGSKDEYVVAYNEATAILLAEKYYPKKQFNSDPNKVWTCH